MQNAYVERLWIKIFGRFDTPRVEQAYRMAGVSMKESLQYNELERVLVYGLIDRGSLVEISEE